MTVEEVVASRPKDCYQCRLFGSVGLVGIGGYLANHAWKNKTLAGRTTIGFFSLAFVNLGVARYKQTYPFEKREAN